MTHIGIATYSHAQQAAIFGLQDLLVTADALQQKRSKSARKAHIEIIDSFSGSDYKKFDAIILPPSLGPVPDGTELTSLSHWIARYHADGALICSVCTGAFPLAATGLLDGRKATTHWDLAADFIKAFPNVQLETDKLIIDDGDIITAGGIMAWTDLGLRLIARFFSLTVMLETAKIFLIDPGIREQSYYNLFSADFSHGDANILKSQQWVHANYHLTISVQKMAMSAGLEERTFLRRFQAATGYKPSEYLQLFRIAKAREKLELTSDSIEIIASDVGYKNTSAFRKLFQKIVGLSPREYRRRFKPA